jgi:methanogenic corrinoid protein MtbC1
MIRWCSYCQKYAGEVPPIESYEITHGICSPCVANHVFDDEDASARLEPIRQFFARLWPQALSGAELDPRALLAQSHAIGIASLDLMMGMLQPLLYDIGERWARGEVTVETEHRISNLTAQLIHFASAEWPAHGRERSQVILLSAQDNYHTLGIQIARAHWVLAGVPCDAIFPALPLAETVALLRRRRPLVVGFSVALPTQMRYVHEVVAELRDAGEQLPRILVGGPIARTGLRPDPGFPIEIVRDLSGLTPELLKQLTR